MILASRPFPPDFPPPTAGLHACQLALIRLPLARPQPRSYHRGHGAARPQQLAARTAPEDRRRAVLPPARRPLGQQQLQSQQRHLRLAVHQGFCPAPQLDLGQRPLVGAEDTFGVPAPAVQKRRLPPTQTRGIQHVGQQPHVLALLAAHPVQPQPQRRCVLIIAFLPPVPNQTVPETGPKPAGVQIPPPPPP